MAQSVWHRDDIRNILIAAAAAPIPPGYYGAGWQAALTHVALAFGIQGWSSPSSRPIDYVGYAGEIGDPPTVSVLIEAHPFEDAP